MRVNGRPKVILIASKLNKAFIGDSTWSWYMPIITSYFFSNAFVKIVSAGNGPFILLFFNRNFLIAGIIILSSSEFWKLLSQWGFSPVIAIFGSLLNLVL